MWNLILVVIIWVNHYFKTKVIQEDDVPQQSGGFKVGVMKKAFFEVYDIYTDCYYLIVYPHLNMYLNFILLFSILFPLIYNSYIV